MGKKCKISSKIDCGGTPTEPPPDTDCDFLASVQAANTNVVVTCLNDNGKTEEMQCADQDGNVLSTFEGKSKKLLKWVVSSECSTGGGGGGGGGEDTCDFLDAVQAANTDVVVACIADNGKTEEMSCSDQDGNLLSTFTGKQKKLLKWVVSSDCSTGGGGGGGTPTCICEDDVSNFLDIQCISDNTWSCTNTSGGTTTFSISKAKKCAKTAGKQDCASRVQKEQNNNKNNNNKNNNKNKNNKNNKKKGK